MTRHSTKRRRKGSAARSTGPAVNERSIELALVLFMAISDLESEESKKRLALLEEEIKDHGASPSLKELIKAGCDRNKLLLSLGLATGQPIDYLYDRWFTKRGPMSIETLFGLNSRAFDALKESLLKAADRIDAINRRFEFGVLLTTPHLGLFQGLPRRLQGYVSLLDLAAERLGRGTHFYPNLGTAILILYVKQQTGRSLHEQVSALLAAANAEDDYDVTMHREWIGEHRPLLGRVSSFIPLFSSNPALLMEAISKI